MCIFISYTVVPERGLFINFEGDEIEIKQLIKKT